MKLGFKQKLALGALDKALDLARRDPEHSLPAILRIVERLDRAHRYQDVYDSLWRMLKDTHSNTRAFVMRLLREADPLFLRRLAANFVVRAGILGYARQNALSDELDCNIPWAILMDPTSACNLHCTGCWAADYDHRSQLPYETLDRIVREGVELGTYFYLFSGGEPLMRKDAVLRLCREHPDCFFLAFSNGTLVDEPFARALRELGNFTLAFSIEGFEEETDMRRGRGTYQKVIHAMDLLREARVPFGFSTCYHAHNTDVVGSDAYVDFLIGKGALFAWYFTYMPVGNDAVPELLASADQRAFMYRQIRRFRSTKPIFALDFWNDGEYVDGCIAGGRRYLHINANGDAEPCAFIHYANANIQDMTLLGVLQSPLFRQYRRHQPFSRNHLRPCPLLDNPGALAHMVHASEARSTDMASPEPVDALTRKCVDAARRWMPVADLLWAQRHEAPIPQGPRAAGPSPCLDCAARSAPGTGAPRIARASGQR
ncbi:MAG: radical SAM protein [Desulfovibrionaceae bacterium]|nr:radical SAM protein [Desulfovibrionaceae bacterium]